MGGDADYAGTDNRDYCKENGKQTSFVKRGRPFSEDKKGILYIFGIHTANVVQLADRTEKRAQLAASRNENMHIEKCFHRGTTPLS